MRKIILIFAVFFITCIGTLAYLFYNGILLFNSPSSVRYPVKGVDVSNWQGEIDWEVIKKQDFKFAFIKATEGSSFIDPYFHSNYENAVKAGLRVGAYHFFSYDSNGANQAEHFINVVENTRDILPPVVDVEFYGEYDKKPPKGETVKPQLDDFIDKIRAAYDMKPIIYTTQKSYLLYIKDNYPDCDIWIRNVFCEPSLPDGRDWTFWQYTDRGRLNGYEGKESFIDINVFNGTEFEFEKYGKTGQIGGL